MTPFFGNCVIRIIGVMESLHITTGIPFFENRASDLSEWLWTMQPDKKVQWGISQDVGDPNMKNVSRQPILSGTSKL
jgi:hypothetical protein